MKEEKERELEAEAYLAMPVEEQQQEQLNVFIKVLEEELKDAESIPENGYNEDKGEGEYFGDYVALANAFFNPEIGYILYALSRRAQDKQFHSKDIPKHCIESMLYLVKMCKENSNKTLSGKYPGGGVMESTN